MDAPVNGSPVVHSKLRRYRPFVRFWLASTVSDFGTYVTTLALSVLILVTMNGTALDQGLVNAARWTPYLLFGLVAGVWIDRFPRRTVLIGGDLGRGLILAGVCVAAAAGALPIAGLMILMFAFGTLALASDAAYQSFLPQLVPRSLLIQANARLQQSDTVAQTTGSAVAGGLVAVLTAPLALLVDAVSYFFSAAVLMTLGRSSDRRPAQGQQSLRAKVAEGLKWVYGHTYLAPMAWSSHIWFIGSSILGAVLPALILQDLGLGAAGLGLVMGCAGVGAVIGTTVSTRLGQLVRYGPGHGCCAYRPAACSRSGGAGTPRRKWRPRWRRAQFSAGLAGRVVGCVCSGRLRAAAVRHGHGSRRAAGNGLPAGCHAGQAHRPHECYQAFGEPRNDRHRSPLGRTHSHRSGHSYGALGRRCLPPASRRGAALLQVQRRAD